MYEEIPEPRRWGTVAVINRGSIITPLAKWIRRLPETVKFIAPEGNQIPRQRNVAGEEMIGQWLLFIDSDVVPPLDALPRLIAHDVPIVSGVCHERIAPFNLAITKSLEPPAKWTVEEIQGHGLMSAPAVGAAGLLIRRDVLEAMETPWFRCGQLYLDYLTEDTEFCLRAAEAGFPTLIDCAVRFGHKIEGIAWPGKDGKMWIEWPGPGDVREHRGSLYSTRPDALPDVVR